MTRMGVVDMNEGQVERGRSEAVYVLPVLYLKVSSTLLPPSKLTFRKHQSV